MSQQNNSPLVSIIIPARNSEKTIDKCLKSLSELNHKNIEIIIINDGSTDKTEQIINDFIENNKDLKIELIKKESMGPSVARNVGIKNSRGEFVAFTDADCIVHKNWLDELLKVFKEDIVSVGGIQLSPEDESEFGKNVNSFMGKVGFITDYMKYIKYKDDENFKPMEIEHNPTCNVMYRKDVFKKVGDFLENLWPGEDVELDYRIRKKGYKIFFTPKAIVYHYRAGDFERYSKMMFNYGKVQAFLVMRYGFFRAIHYVPILLILLLGFLIYSAFLSLWYLLLLLICMDLAVGAYFFIRTGKISLMINYGMLFYTTVLFWNLGFFRQIITREIK